MNLKKELLGLTFALFIFQGFTTPALAIDVPVGGVINTHDMDSFKELEREQQMKNDFEKFQKTEEKQPKEEDEVKKKRTKDDQEAKVEELATKGVFVKNIKISPSKILTEKELKKITDKYTNDNLTIEEMKAIVKDINALYLKKGFVTARAFLPPQTVKDKTIKITLVEGKVGNITVKGNEWTTTDYIKDRIELDTLKKGNIFNINDLENNVVIFNKYNDGVALKGTLSPGKAKETTDVVVNVKEKSPFHVTAIFDNGGRESIGVLRGGLFLQHDSLTKHRDKLTVGAYANKYSITPFADYNIPVNRYDGRIGATFSYSNSKVAHGDFEDYDIDSNSYNYSLYYSQPIIRKSYMDLSGSASLTYKQATTNFSGEELYTNKITTAQIGATFRYDTQRGIWYAYQNIGYSFPIFDKESNYLNLNGGVTRLHDFGHDIIGQFRGNYQYIPKDIVPSVDQYQLGGMNTVRGYSEGAIIGRSGYFVSAEFMFPIAPKTISSSDKKEPTQFIGSFVKGIAFVDHGMVFPYKGSGLGAEDTDSGDMLLSAGVGLKINLPYNLNAKLSWGFPLHKNNHSTAASWGAFHFVISFSPDFDQLLKSRKPKK